MVVEFVTNGMVSGFRRQSLRKPQEVAVGENEENGWVAGWGGGVGGEVSRTPPVLSSETEGGGNSLCRIVLLNNGVK